MLNPKESFQPPLSPILADSYIPGKESKEKGAAYVLLSQSKLEQLAQYQDNPTLNPSPLTNEQLGYITAGIIFHQLVQVASTWRSILPLSTTNIKANYEKNLHRQLQTANPTTRFLETKLFYHLLHDDRLVFPSIRGSQFDAPKRTVYHLLAEKIIQHEKSKAPFTDTPVIDERYDELDGQVFPKPEQFCQTWNDLNLENILYNRTENLLQYHENLIFHPSTINHHSPGNYGQELRTNMFIPQLGIIWTTRFDEIYFTQNPSTGKRHITIHDFKLNSPKLAKQGTYARDMQKLSLFLTAMAAYSLPDTLPITGKSIQTSIKNIDPETEITIKYLGLKSYPPQTINFTKYFGHTWIYPNSAQGQIKILYQTLDFINQNKPSLTHIFPPRKFS